MDAKRERAVKKLPETGDIDHVPYQKIDMLWNLIDHATTSNLVPTYIDAEQQEEMLAARKNMEAAMETHLALASISEMGLKSARALQQQSGN